MIKDRDSHCHDDCMHKWAADACVATSKILKQLSHLVAPSVLSVNGPSTFHLILAMTSLPLVGCLSRGIISSSALPQFPPSPVCIARNVGSQTAFNACPDVSHHTCLRSSVAIISFRCWPMAFSPVLLV